VLVTGPSTTSVASPSPPSREDRIVGWYARRQIRRDAPWNVVTSARAACAYEIIARRTTGLIVVAADRCVPWSARD